MTGKEAKERLEKQYKRQNKYITENYDRISVTLPKGTKARIKAAGKTCNGLINALVMEWLERQEQNAATLPEDQQQIRPENWPFS